MLIHMMGPQVKWLTVRQAAWHPRGMEDKERSLRRFYPHLTWIVVGCAIAWGLVASLLKLYPPIGVYIAALGLFAGLITILPPERRLEKLGIVVLLTILGYMEIHNLYRDRDEHDAEQAKALKEEKDNFKAIADSLRNEMTQNQSQFAATMQSQQKAISLADTGLKNITGYGSVPCITPQSHAIENNEVPLVVWNRGQNDLTGVELRMLSQNEFTEALAIFNKPAISLGTIHPTWPKPIPNGVHPIVGANGEASFIAEIWTQNGFYTELLKFRKGKYALPWAYQYWLTKHTRIGPHGMEGNILGECNQGQWSDDLGDGKPTSK
jgi:hypothetical protein